MFLHSWAKRTEHLFDLTGSITYLLMLGFAVWASTSTNRSWLLLALVAIWALRLGPFLYNRIKKAGEDRRFRSIKAFAPTLLMTWTLQGLWVFITASCALAAITSTHQPALGPIAAVGFMLWVIGFGIEIVADSQKTRFRSQPENADAFITGGLWAWSRHPNYFGEIILWTGIAVIAFPALTGWQYLTLISPIFVVLLLTKISGVRMLESRGERRWGNDPEYQAYKANTPVLVMRPPRSR